ncbi:hypothetical protein ACSVDE_08245 [Pseudalkalibacillus sp. Hm43]|uniref:hypothetical protein n=1 Tax=Pseudalkalibacillus sp. Hm43 TaxID=3450742 RepID=UPI003F42FB46
MFTRFFSLIIGYWSFYIVVIEIPTTNMQEFRRWLGTLIFQPVMFVTISFMSMVGILAYGFMIKKTIRDLKDRSKGSLFQKALFVVLLLTSWYFLFQMNVVVMLILLPCTFFYGIISILQANKHVRRQEGVE